MIIEVPAWLDKAIDVTYGLTPDPLRPLLCGLSLHYFRFLDEVPLGFVSKRVTYRCRCGSNEYVTYKRLRVRKDAEQQ